ncbi:MAG: DUF167 domain-containing protein [bacterium]
MIVKVRVIPNSKKSEMAGRIGHILRIRVAAPPEENKANEELVDFMADFFEVKEKMVKIIRGHKAREKTISINGRPEDDLEDLMETIP